MLNFLKRKEAPSTIPELYAPIDGTLIAMDDVKDPVFAQKMMGDGFALTVTGSEVYALQDCVVTMLFPTNHAFGLTLADGLEILVHIGIDTVNENGKGFTSHVKANQKVKAGEKIISFDKAYLESRGYDLTTMVIFANPETYATFSCPYGTTVTGGKDIAATYTK